MPATPGYYARGPEPLIVSLAARGDRDAFTELVRRRQPWLRNLMRRFSGDPVLADDLSQRVFLKAWRSIRRVKHPERFGAWLKKAAVNEWIDHQRKHGHVHEDDADQSLPPAPEAKTAEAIDLDSALATLPDPLRLCVVLSYHERLSHSEIAELTGLPAGTIKSHIRRGSQKLRELLSAYGESV
jgi:RNA polymerase sigma-70 factor (ECF subfamily)